MKNALIIHGAYGQPNENWIPWLTEMLETCGYEVVVPTFPTPENQSLQMWQDVMKNTNFAFNEQSIIIGHSIGATFALNLLEKHAVQKAVLVAGFISNLTTSEEDYTELDTINVSFYDRDIDWHKIRENCANITLFHSDNDPYVSQRHGKELADNLGTESQIVKNAGHFNADAGFIEFPQLFESIRESLVERD